MMRKTKITAALLLAMMIFTGAMTAQTKEGKLSNVQKLTNDRESYENPKWSPDGTKIAFTKSGFEGLLVMDKNGQNKKTLSDATDAGYGYQWSVNNDEILIRDTRWDSQKGRLHAIWSVDLKGNKEKLSEDAAYLQPAAWKYATDGTVKAKVVDGKAIERVTKKTKTANVASLKALQAKPNFNKSFFVDGENFYLVDENGKKNLLNDQNTYCPVFSPDGTKIAFNQNDDVYVMNIDGSNKRKLATGFYPTWVNNKQIVFELTTDDGHMYTSGDLFMINVDGTNKKQLTNTRDQIEMFPSCSPDGSKLLYVNGEDGQIYSADLR
ncbi:MAG: TolB family protein [Dysgonomonas sp.]